MSISELLTTKYGYESKVIPIEYPILEKEKYVVLFKQKICAPNGKTIMMFRIRLISNCSDAYILQYFRFKLVTIDDHQHNIMFDQIEGVNLNLQETNYTVPGQFSRVELEQDQNYILMMEGKSPYNVSEGTFEIEILFKNEEKVLNIENLEMVIPVEFNDKYIPGKYGIIFRERLFVANTVCASFFLRLAQIPQVQEQKDARPVALKGKKSQEQIDIPEIEFSCKRLVKLELFQDDKLIVYNYGFNSAYISNIFLMSTKENIGAGLGSLPQSQHSQKGQLKQQDKSIERDDKYRNYYLQATFDLRDWPECKTLNEDTKDLIWLLRAFSSDTIIMMRDTQKEDAEKELKKSWEDKEPGRAEKAKRTHKKYFLQLKKDRGEDLTSQELELLNEPRLTKKQREEEQKLVGGKGKIAAMKAPVAKPAPGKGIPGKKGQQDDSTVEIKERELPLSKAHNMQEIQAFLEHMEKDRIIAEQPEHGGEVDIRSIENIQSIEETLKMAKAEFKNLQERNQERREEIKQLQEKRKQEYLTAIDQQKQEYKQELTQVLAEREEIKQQMSQKKEKEKVLIALCQQDKPVQADLEKVIQESEQTPDFDIRLISIAQKVLINAKIQTVIEKLEQSVAQFELEPMEEAVGIIEEWQIKVDENLLKNAYEIIEEARDNPDYITQKQNELKKVSKKPGKR